MKQKAVTIALLVLMSTALLFTSASAPKVNGQVGLYIYEVTLQGDINAISNSTVGTPVTLIGTIDTVNGSYTVYLGDKLVDTGNSEVHYVASNFTIPQVPGGNYNLTLTDVSEGLNFTYPFPILTAYSVQPIVPTSPSQLQEGNSVNLNVTITGGQANTGYGAEITVALPPNLNTSFTKTISLTSSSEGTAQTMITYPDTSFSPSGSTIIYAGAYTAYFNKTAGLAQKTFTVGFTDLTQYHRQDVVKINAVGYQPGQSATLAIQFNSGVISSQNVTASDQGIINATYQIPSNAAIGTYTVTITPQISPSKSIPDIQNFQVIGYPVNFTTVNLAGEIVPGILLEAVDEAASGAVYSNSTDFLGFAMINLEKGDVTVNAYWNQVKVGSIDITVTGTGSYTITCQLSDLEIAVQDKNGVAIPFTNLNVTYQYVTRTGETKTGTAFGQTDLSGVYTFNSTLPNVSYTINASKYDKVFNVGNNTISNLPAQPTTQATIICPDESLTLNVVDNNGAAISNSRVTLIEQASGIFYSLTTDSNGNAQLQVTFGQYRLSVYTSNNVLLNETIVNVLSNTQTQIQCVLSNLQLSVKVVDYFGTPISNVAVQLIRTGMSTQSATTKNDGTVTFDNILGGSIEITAYPTGNPDSFIASNVQVSSSTTVNLSMDKYVVFGGALVGTSVLATLLIIVTVIVVIAVIEVLKRIGFKIPRRKQN